MPSLAPTPGKIILWSAAIPLAAFTCYVAYLVVPTILRIVIPAVVQSTTTQ